MSILFPSSSLLTGTEADTGEPMGTIFLTSSWSLTWSVFLLLLIFRFRFFSYAFGSFIFIARISSFVSFVSSCVEILLAISSSTLAFGASSFSLNNYSSKSCPPSSSTASMKVPLQTSLSKPYSNDFS